MASCSLALVAVQWSGVTPASADLKSAGCILLILCPPTTPATTPPTTHAPVTTAPPTTAARPTTTAPAAKRSTTPATTGRVTATRPAVGAGGVAAPSAGPIDLPALGTGSDPAAPQLAGTSAPTTTVAANAPLVSLVPLTPSGLVGTARGLPDDHARVRVLLSILALLIAAVAVAQLPSRRRTPQADTDALN